MEGGGGGLTGEPAEQNMCLAHTDGVSVLQTPTLRRRAETHRELSGQELAESNKLNENGTKSKGKLFIPAL